MKKLVICLLAIMLITSLAGCQLLDLIKQDEPIAYPKPEYTASDDFISSADANDDAFAVSSVTKKENSPLEGKVIYWLGSSVTYGSGAEGESMADYLAATTGAICRKEAVSGTTIFDDGGDGDSGAGSYTRRLVNSTVFDKNEKVDAFICQISTNDAATHRITSWGALTDDNVTSNDEFDRSTTIGGIEFIIAYVTETWGCPVYFYSGAEFTNQGTRLGTNPSSDNYGRLVDRVERAVEKWSNVEGVRVGVINMFEDADFNAAVSDSYYTWAMKDSVHPKRAAYLQWWTPYIENYLVINLTMKNK